MVEDNDNSEVTSIQVSQGLRRRMKILCAIRDITYEKLIEELVDEKEQAIKKSQQ